MATDLLGSLTMSRDFHVRTNPPIYVKDFGKICSLDKVCCFNQAQLKFKILPPNNNAYNIC